MPFEHRPWSTFGDADKIAPINPLRRVPTLVLEDGEALLESGAILDYLDELAGAERALIAERGPERRRALRVCALATGLADKAVSLFYERAFHPQISQTWVDRCRAQIGDVLQVLETGRAAAPGSYWFGETIGHADIAAACALALCRRGASRPRRPRPVPRAGRPRGKMRGVAGVPGDQPALHPTRGLKARCRARVSPQGGSCRLPSSRSVKKGFQATSHQWPSGSAKYPV